MKVGLVGYGAMGKIVAELLGDDLACVVAKEYENGLKSLFDYKEKLDCIIDFSNPSNLDMILDYAVVFKTPCVLATTGFSDAQIEKINNASKDIAILRSANFSLGVILMNKLVKEMTAVLKDGFDIEVIEKHHNRKLDAPSGTAKMLISSIEESTNYHTVCGREGISKREPNEIGVHSIRGGSIVGEHEVLFCGNDEVLSIKHEAHSRKIFGVGACKAAKFLKDKKNGLYDMEDILFHN